MDKRFELEEAQASFRGVPFHVLKRARDGGRRGPTHELPQRDEPDGEDLGRKMRSFKVDAMVIGDDYLRRASALIAALEDKSGGGIYRDPWHGEWFVICRTYSAVDDDHRQGLTTLSLTFEETGDTRYPQARTDSASTVEQSAGAMAATSTASFGREFSLKGQPQFVADHAAELVKGALSRLTGLNLPRLDPVSAMGVSDTGIKVSDFTHGLPTALRSDLGGGMADLFRSFGSGAYSRRAGIGDADAARTGFASLNDFGQDLPPIPATTSTRRVQAANQAALVGHVRRLALTEEARALAARRWDSLDTAMAERGQTLSRLDAVMREAGRNGDDAVFEAAKSLRDAVTVDVASRAGPLPRLRRVTLDNVLPARVVAHRLLGDGSKAEDLVARNRIGHPAFVPAGTPLEVLDG